MGTVKTGKPATSYQGIWATGTSGELFLVTQAQAQAPDCPTGAKFSTFAQLVLPDQGGPVFVANLASGAGGITTGNSQGIWAVDTNGRINLVARTGDAVVIDGKTKFIKSLSIFATSAATVGQTRSFNASGDLIYKVAFTDNTQAIIQIVFP